MGDLVKTRRIKDGIFITAEPFSIISSDPSQYSLDHDVFTSEAINDIIGLILNGMKRKNTNLFSGFSQISSLRYKR